MSNSLGPKCHRSYLMDFCGLLQIHLLPYPPQLPAFHLKHPGLLSLVLTGVFCPCCLSSLKSLYPSLEMTSPSQYLGLSSNVTSSARPSLRELNCHSITHPVYLHSTQNHLKLPLNVFCRSPVGTCTPKHQWPCVSYSLKYHCMWWQHRAVIKFLNLRISTDTYSKLRWARHCSNCSMCIYSFLISRGMVRSWHYCYLNFRGETTKTSKNCGFDYPQSQIMELISNWEEFWTPAVSCGACALITIVHPLSPHGGGGLGLSVYVSLILTLPLHFLRPNRMWPTCVSIFNQTGSFFAILSLTICISVLIRINSCQTHGLISYLIAESLRQKSPLPPPGSSGVLYGTR